MCWAGRWVIAPNNDEANMNPLLLKAGIFVGLHLVMLATVLQAYWLGL